MNKPIRVALADDHPVLRDGLRRILELEPDIIVVGEAGDGNGALRLMQEIQPDVIVLDLMMPGATGLDAIRRARAEGLAKQTRILVLTAISDRRHLVEAVRMQVDGVLTKDAPIEKFIRAVRTVAAGQCWIERDLLAEAVRKQPEQVRPNFGLSVREVEIILAVASGASNKELAGRLAISELTVKRHLTNIFQKIGVTSRLELALFAVSNNIGAAAA